MLREFLSATSLFNLPLVAMGIFIAFFFAVLVRIGQRMRAPEYQRMANLPLDDDTQGNKLP